ncbi:MAG: S-adenosylmethionine decarboxylase [bacterium]
MLNIKDKNRKKVFGQELMMNLYGCDLEVMCSRKKMQEFCEKVCKIINITPVGRAIIKNTGTGDIKGYSVCQFLVTSTIVIHTCDPILETYINIFSCRLFKNKEAVEFTKKFFKPKKIKKLSLFR